MVQISRTDLQAMLSKLKSYGQHVALHLSALAIEDNADNGVNEANQSSNQPNNYHSSKI